MNTLKQDEAERYDGVVLRESHDDSRSLQRSLEALLFVAGEALSIKRLATLTQASETGVAAALQNIAEEYADRGMVLREVAGGYRFASASAARAVVEAYLAPPKTSLSGPAMETLAIIAYLQPVTRADIEAVRGVNVDSVVSTLVDRGFIGEAGKREVPGRPTLYKTTAEFLEAFGLRSPGDLPPVDVDLEKPQADQLELVEEKREEQESECV
jgi:segregation and condensation protein B